MAAGGSGTVASVHDIDNLTNSVAENVKAPQSPSAPAPSADIGGHGWHSFSGNDNENRHLRVRCATALAAYNAQPITASMEERIKAWNHSSSKEVPLVKNPFYVDYGTQVRIAASAYLHRNVYLADNPRPETVITIGERTVIGANVHILTVKHEVDWRHRHGANGSAWAAPVIIGEDCYIGSHAVILAGVTIGKCSVIGAGAVVAKSIPAYHVAVGNPAQPVRKVALDAPDAPGLSYERQGERMIVVQKTTNISSGSSANLDKAGPNMNAINPELPPMWYPGAIHGRPESRPEPIMRSLSRQRTPPSKYRRSRREQVRVIAPESPVSGSAGVDVCLLVAAVLIAWLILHSVLY